MRIPEPHNDGLNKRKKVEVEVADKPVVETPFDLDLDHHSRTDRSLSVPGSATGNSDFEAYQAAMQARNELRNTPSSPPNAGVGTDHRQSIDPALSRALANRRELRSVPSPPPNVGNSSRLDLLSEFKAKLNELKDQTETIEMNKPKSVRKTNVSSSRRTDPVAERIINLHREAKMADEAFQAAHKQARKVKTEVAYKKATDLGDIWLEKHKALEVYASSHSGYCICSHCGGAWDPSHKGHPISESES